MKNSAIEFTIQMHVYITLEAWSSKYNHFDIVNARVFMIY